MPARKLSDKQESILRAILKGNRDDKGELISWLDLDQLLERIDYQTTKESMQFSLRHLIKRGFIINGEPELRRGRRRRILVPTQKAMEAFDQSGVSFELRDLYL